METQIGINAHATRQVEHYGLIGQAGIKWARLTFDWSIIEQREGNYNFGAFEDAVNRLRAMGVEIFVSLAYTPNWLGKPHGGRPTRRGPWERFVETSVSRFKDRVHYWGLWNEPNLQNNWDGSPEEFRDIIIIPGYAAAKHADNTCTVLGPELVCVKEWWKWFTIIATGAGAGSVDIVSLHIYEYRGPDLALKKLTKGAEGYGDLIPSWLRWLKPFFPQSQSIKDVLINVGWGNKPLWLTEIGWETKGTASQRPVSDEQQAQFCLEMCQRVKNGEGQLGAVFFYEFIDDPNTSIPPWGLVRANGTPKASWQALQKGIA